MPAIPPLPDKITDEMIYVPRWAIDMLFGEHGGYSRLCGVCTGYSPIWDGHDKNPPCEGAAKDALRSAFKANLTAPPTRQLLPEDGCGDKDCSCPVCPTGQENTRRCQEEEEAIHKGNKARLYFHFMSHHGGQINGTYADMVDMHMDDHERNFRTHSVDDMSVDLTSAFEVDREVREMHGL